MSSGGAVAMTNSPLPPPSIENQNPSSVGLPAISSPIPSGPELKKEPSSFKMSPSSSGYHSVPVSDIKVEPYSNAIKVEPMEESSRGMSGSSCVPPIKMEIMEEPTSNSVGHVGKKDSPVLQNNSLASQPGSVPSLPDVESGNSSHGPSPAAAPSSKKDFQAATPPSTRSRGPLSQDSGVPSLSDSKPSPRVEENKKIVPVKSLEKG